MENPITSIVKGMIAPVTSLISEFIVDKDKAADIAYKISTLAATQAHAETMGQLEVNKVEAAHKSIFVAGWRPAVGWICGLGLAYNVLAYPIMEVWFTMPEVNTALLETTLYGMLGLGAMRSFEKMKGVAREK
jgi:hypothetical protein